MGAHFSSPGCLQKRREEAHTEPDPSALDEAVSVRGPGFKALEGHGEVAESAARSSFSPALLTPWAETGMQTPLKKGFSGGQHQ